MKISIVTPSFDQGVFIEDAIQSVLTQGHADLEHIIVDNCSTDTTASVLARYPHLKVICEPDKGQSDALNKGFKAATGDVVGWLNADDRYLPGCFDHVLKGLEQDPGIDILYGDYRLIDKGGRLLRLRKELPFDPFMAKYLHMLYIPTTTTFFRRKIFDEGNFIDADYQCAMDYEFCLRLVLKKYKFRHLPLMLADFRWHEDAKSQKLIARQRYEMKKALLTLDPHLKRYPGRLRYVMRYVLMSLARVKRGVWKLLKGAY